MLSQYLPILVFLIVAAVIAVAAVMLGKIIGKILRVNRPDSEKASAYECGFPEFDDARSRFDIKFYLIAILFIVFDLEVAFLFPFAVSVRGLGHHALCAVGIFLVLLAVGFVYEWKKGALEWE
jgi:NADH-quinone oxidoreductase subunit A